MVGGENIEYTIHPTQYSDFYKEFGQKLQVAEILYETNTEGTKLLEEANDFYSSGTHWDAEKILGHKLWFEGRLSGMKSHTDSDLLSHKYFSDIYPRLFNYWYWIKQGRYSQPIYVAWKEIEESDQDYATQINHASNTKLSLEQRTDAVEKLKEMIFGNT